MTDDQKDKKDLDSNDNWKMKEHLQCSNMSFWRIQPM